MKKVPITLTFPCKELNTKKDQDQMAQAFKEAAKDEELNAEFEMWDSCIGDCIDASIQQQFPLRNALTHRLKQ